MKKAFAAAAATTALALMQGAFAAEQPFPSKVVRIIVPLAPGGGTDNLTRIMQPKLSEVLGQQVIVDNRPGAGGQIGTEVVARAAPDGYTILNVESSFASNPSIFRKLPYDTLKDFAPITLLATTPNVLIIHPSVPAKNLKELVALGRVEARRSSRSPWAASAPRRTSVSSSSGTRRRSTSCTCPTSRAASRRRPRCSGETRDALRRDELRVRARQGRASCARSP